MPPDASHGSGVQSPDRRERCLACESAKDTEAVSELDVASDLSCYCQLDGVFNLVSKKYALQIIDLLETYGSLRFNEVEDQLVTTSSSTLTNRLEELTAVGLIERRSYDEIPPRVEYTLTSRGQDFIVRLQPLLEWVSADDN
jgi:DNA-binding HxlR family transcriptional regulator